MNGDMFDALDGSESTELVKKESEPRFICDIVKKAEYEKEKNKARMFLTRLKSKLRYIEKNLKQQRFY